MIGLLAHMNCKRFYCNRRSATLAREVSFVKREAQYGKSVSVSSHARDEIRFTRNALSGDFTRSHHDKYGLVPQHTGKNLAGLFGHRTGNIQMCDGTKAVAADGIDQESLLL